MEKYQLSVFIIAALSLASTSDYFALQKPAVSGIFDFKDSIQDNIQSLLADKVSQLQQKFLPSCNTTIQSLRYLLEQLCRTAQAANATTRAACITCVDNATSNPLTTTLLSSLVPCMNLYLNNTAYSSCITILQASLANGIQVNVNTHCPTGYCGFVQCVRRINTNTLIQQCYANSLPGNNVTTPTGQVNHYLLTTSCILAMTRCNAINPITGAPQNNRLTTTITTNTLLGPKTITTSVPFYNTLQVSSTGDLRIFSTPRTAQPLGYFCQNSASLNQTGWGTIQCN